jgi:hypothetical protein
VRPAISFLLLLLPHSFSPMLLLLLLLSLLPAGPQESCIVQVEQPVV